MRSKSFLFVILMILTLTALGLAKPNNNTASHVASVYAAMPVVFEPNVGQVAQPVRFVSRESGYDAYVTDHGFVMVGRARGTENRPSIELHFLGGQTPANMNGRDPLSAHTNYFVGPKTKWHVGVPQYRAVEAEGIYPGINLRYYGTQRQLEYDIVVAPGADPTQIQIGLKASSNPTLDSEGNVEFRGAENGFVLHRPVAYQEIDSRRQRVKASYVLKDGTLTLALGRYDKQKPLVIDPVLSYATYLGGSGFDNANGIAVDAVGNSYLTGQTCSADLAPATRTYAGDCDAYVVALKADGTAKYTTYLGGSNGEKGQAIAISKTTGAVVIVGMTGSADFPIVGSAFQPTYGGLDTDGFVAQLDSTGLLTYSSFLGGSDNDIANGVVINSAEDIVIVGQTRSTDFPGLSGTYVPDYDVFILKLLHSGTAAPYQYSSAAFGRYYDTLPRPLGTDSFTCDTANAVSLDSHDDIFITGTSIPQCQVPGNKAEYVVKFQGTDGSFVYGWVNLQKPSEGFAVAVDTLGEAVVAGVSGGGALVQKVNAVGSDVIFTNVFAAQSSANAIALDANGAIYVGGTTSLSTLPVVSPTQSLLNGASDAFVAKFDQSGATELFSTYYGGAGSESGNALALGPDASCPTSLPSCAIYLAGTTYSADLPVTANAVRPSGDSNFAGDAFLAKWLGTNLPYASAAPIQLTFGDQPLDTSSVEQTVMLTNKGDAPLQITGINASGDFIQHNDCTQPSPASGLAAGESCAIHVTFIPTAAGIRSGAITIVDNAVNSPNTVSLVGNGVTAVVDVTPTIVTFADTGVGTTSAVQTITLTNNGAAVLQMKAVSASGDFSVQATTCTGSLQVNASCTVSLTFTPTAVGSRTGLVTINDDATSAPQTVPLNGTGTAVISLSQTTMDFDDQPVSVSATKRVVVTNGSQIPLYIASINASGDFYAQRTNCGTTLVSGAFCWIDVVFTPTAVGPRTGTLTITDTATNSPQTVLLAGNGLANIMTVTPFAITFEDQTVATTSAPQTVTVTNTSTIVLAITQISTSGDFLAQSSTCGATLAPADWCAVKLVFLPTAVGRRSGGLSISDSATNSPQTVILAGNGVTTSTGGGGGGSTTPDFQLTLSPATASVSPGGSGVFTVTSMPVGGLAATVTFSCSVAETTMKCGVSPTSVTLDGTHAKDVALTVTTLAPSSGPPASVGWNRGPVSRPYLFAGVVSVPFGVVGIVLVGFGRGRGSRKRRAVIAGTLLLLAIVMLAPGCSNSSNRYGTPTGNYSVNITATSGSTSHSTTATLTVK